jgi:CBS domain-containing protein
MNISEIMTKKVVTLKHTDTIKDAIIKFAQYHISGAPVVDDENNVVGIVSEADILKTLRTRYKELKLVFRSIPMMSVYFTEHPKKKGLSEALKEVYNSPLSKIMKTDVVTINTTDLVEDAIPLMTSKKVNRLPVLDTNKKLVGIVTRGDIIAGLSKISKKEM